MLPKGNSTKRERLCPSSAPVLQALPGSCWRVAAVARTAAV